MLDTVCNVENNIFNTGELDATQFLGRAGKTTSCFVLDRRVSQ